uniref:Cytochrome c biogenesis protein CcsB n=1 Tax=Eustigmatophyceae sp. Ndem 8/9T-3m6.8 TaxID=2506146 RepID=A0A3R5QNN3_9STRA|nr:cytochrome c biogenesis protein [Eustigmatophyceae sp. Ndem 8/9T-3m6.8]QAA11841.1 cytochrome c biogenesis protein [Eustigmatophyceae sp. Ndem 8/9T-3m6.8]
MRQILRWVADMRVAISIVSILVVLSILGSVLDQGESTPVQLISNFDQSVIPKDTEIKSFQSYPIFSSFIFRGFAFLFGVSLLACTYLQQLPSYDICRGVNFFKRSSIPFKSDLDSNLSVKHLRSLINKLFKANYSLFQKRNWFYAYQGLAGRFGPIIVHFSIICILVGALVSALFGFNVQELVPKGEIVYLQNIPSPATFDYLPLFPIRINDFWITYQQTGITHQFYSNISILSEFGEEKNWLTLSVNHPLNFDNYQWYQTDWDIVGFTAYYDKIFYQIPFTELTVNQTKNWVSWLPFPNEERILLLQDLTGKLFAIDRPQKLQDILEFGSPLYSSINLVLLEVISCTGLQIRFDPGTVVIYLGFALLIISAFISYSSYSRIWIIMNASKIKIIGVTNRSKQGFMLQILELINSLF